ncbi:MAG: hypothetical protein H8E18_00035 [FCB group bacterium]|nr:hypothetical protein [FCB group bacterium]
MIPTTAMRRFYSFLKMYNSNTILQVARDVNASVSKQKKFANIICKSSNHFSIYSNVEEPFLSENSTRKKLPPFDTTGLFKNTQEVISFLLKKRIQGAMLKPSNIEREIDPRRATRAVFDDGRSGRSSGVGGADLIAWDEANDKPMVGEIKTRGDENAFYALIQVINYFIEFSTAKQIERCNHHNLFGKPISPKQKFTLAIIFADFNHRSARQIDILEQSKNLAAMIEKEFEQIHNIIFVNIEKTMKDFEVL